MSVDPPVRADGLCAVCLKPRKPERSRRYGGAAAETDPFDSTDCAREWHGCPREEPVLASAVAKRTRLCSGCGCSLDEERPGCPACYQRHVWRKQRMTA